MTWLSSGLGAQLRREAGENTEAIRAAMLRLLDADTEAGATGSLARRVLFASDAEGLWYLRSEIMSVLASSRGEAAARELLAGISVLFHEVLPEGLASPLRAHRAVAGVR